MKKLFLSLMLALLMGPGVVFAANIPAVVDAETGGPEVWITSVYNNSGSTLSAGSVVVWDIGSSTGDNDNWVTTTTTADSYLVAGVVWPNSITAANTGSIAIKGPVTVNVQGGLQAAGGLACTSGTAGEARSCITDAAAFGIVTLPDDGDADTAIVNVNRAN